MKIVYREESYAIMGACFEVYKEMGCGLKELVYHECLGHEFRFRNIEAVHRAQVHNNLKSTGYKLGLLVNFGHHPHVEYERIVNDPNQ